MRHYEIVFMVHPDQSEQVPGMIERYTGAIDVYKRQVLASNSARPLIRLNIPNAVPRSSGGAVWATIAANSPWVIPM